MTAALAPEGLRLRLRGQVQGVGMRPAIWRLAREYALAGRVRNDGAGVLLELWGDMRQIDALVDALLASPPPLARIDSVEKESVERESVARASLEREGLSRPGDFVIESSDECNGGATTAVLPDAATCRSCHDEVLDPNARRYRYPFANCTHCGPRLSIQAALPWDRAGTSMAPFALCADCRAEYDNPADRRFHAQPIACPACGPRLQLLTPEGEPWPVAAEPLAVAAELLAQGKILAIKGLGGFHLACDAGNAEAVARLRRGKHRDAKPFALMARDLAMVSRYCRVDAAAAAALSSSAAPIVLLPRKPRAPSLAPALAPGLKSLGVMLPATPLQQLLLADCRRPLVMTSGNFSGEPPCIDNDEAGRRLGGMVDALLVHDRAIVNRVDDSVVRPMAGAVRLLRLARGYAPARLPLPPGLEGAPPLLALGAELKASFCLLQGDGCVLSQYIGDLDEVANLEDFQRALARYTELFRSSPGALVVDRHPNYRSARLGRDWARRDGLALVEVQHHHAHIAACMGENAVPAGTPVLGVALDGLGFAGDEGRGDAQWWGGEFLLADYRGYRRLGRLQPLPLIGGDRAMAEPWRNAFAHINAAMGWEAYRPRYPQLPLTQFLATRPLPQLQRMLANGRHCPPSSAAGRWFDAVAAALDICCDRQDYEGQAAMQLEALAESAELAGNDKGYPLQLVHSGGLWELQPAPLWPALLDDLAAGVPAAQIAARFHGALATGIAELIARLFEQRAVAPGTPVALSGGVFQNRLLLERLLALLQARGLTVLTHRHIPPNDGGLALGQALVAAAQLRGGAGDMATGR